MSEIPEGYTRVVFACECNEDGDCPECGLDFGECDCIGPTEDDVNYIVIDDVMYGNRLA